MLAFLLSKAIGDFEPGLIASIHVQLESAWSGIVVNGVFLNVIVKIHSKAWFENLFVMPKCEAFNKNSVS